MKIWAKTILHHKILSETVQEFASARPSDCDGWRPIICELVRPLDVAVPVLLPKHAAELKKFSRTVFKAADFMEPIAFDHLEIELFPEKKKDANVAFSFDRDASNRS